MAEDHKEILARKVIIERRKEEAPCSARESAPRNTCHMYEGSLGRYRKGGSGAHQKPRNAFREGWVSPGRKRHGYCTVSGPPSTYHVP